MKRKFAAIHSVLSMIETKGEQTKMMADCLRFVEQCINECEEQEMLTQNEVKKSEG